jgi:uncharacterized protein (DUF1499 family)
MSQKFYEAQPEDPVDMAVAAFLNENAVHIPVARLHSSSYLMGTELTYPYLKGNTRLMVNVEDLSVYLKRNEKIQQSKIKALMCKSRLGYRDIVKGLIERHIVDDHEVDRIMENMGR